MQEGISGKIAKAFISSKLTILLMIAFLLIGHTQSHLGQISVWRRIMGLGSAL